MKANPLSTFPLLRRPALGPLCVAAAFITLAGCSLPLPKPESDPTRTYVLSAPALTSAPANPGARAPSVRLRPIELASYLRSRSLVIRRGENEIDFREFARWGEPLEQGITRLLREELLASGAASAVQAPGMRSGDHATPAVEISVRVLAAEGSADGTVLFRAAWEVTGVGENADVIQRGDFRAADLRWSPRQEASLAAGISRGVAALAQQIAAAMPKPSA